MLNPVTPDVGEDVLLITPVPETTVHDPVPTMGVLAANDEEEEQIVWSGPASAVVGSGSLKIVTWSTDAGHVPFETVH